MSCHLSLNNSFKVNSDPIHWSKNSINDGSVKLAGEEAKDRLYEPKHEKKLVRVLTVVAYIFFVSLAGIMLSLYYVFIWNGHLKETSSVKTIVLPFNTGCENDKLAAASIEQTTTTEYEDTTALPLQQNFTQQSDEYDNINSNLEELEKSVLIKKLIRHHNMIPR